MRAFFDKIFRFTKRTASSLFNVRLARKNFWIIPALAIIAMLVSMPGAVYAGADTGSLLGDVGDGVTTAITEFLLVTARLAIGLTVFFLRFFITLASYNNYINTPVVQVGWIMVRDVANMFFVVALLVIAFGTILGIEQYEWKRGLVKLILGAIFINFSNLIAQLFIDVAHVFTITFLNAIAATAGGNLIQMFHLTEILSFVQKPKVDDVSNVRLELLAGAIMATFFAVFAAVAMGSYVLVMVARVVLLWVLIILSPLAFIFQVLPATQGYAQTWFKEFKEQVIVAPVMVFFLWLTFATLGSGQVIRDIQDGSGGRSSVIPLQSEATDEVALSLSKISSWERMASFLVAISFLFIGLKQVGETGAVGGKIIGNAMNFGKKVAEYATGYATGRWLVGKGKDAAGGIVSGVGKGIKLAAWKAPWLGGEKWKLRGENLWEGTKGMFYGRGMQTTPEGEQLAKELEDLHKKKKLSSENPEEREAALAQELMSLKGLKDQRKELKKAGAKDEQLKTLDEKISRQEAVVKSAGSMDPKQIDKEIRQKEKKSAKEMKKAGGSLGQIARAGISLEKQVAKTKAQAEVRKKILWKRTGSEAGGYIFGNVGRRLGLGWGMGTDGLFRSGYLLKKLGIGHGVGLGGDPDMWKKDAQDRYERGWLKAEEMRSAAKDREVEQQGKLDVLLKPRLKFDLKKGKLNYEVDKGDMLDRIVRHDFAGETREKAEENAKTERRQKIVASFEKTDNEIKENQAELDKVNRELSLIEGGTKQSELEDKLANVNEEIFGVTDESRRKELEEEKKALEEKLQSYKQLENFLFDDSVREKAIEAVKAERAGHESSLETAKTEESTIDAALEIANKGLVGAATEDMRKQYEDQISELQKQKVSNLEKQNEAQARMVDADERINNMTPESFFASFAGQIQDIKTKIQQKKDSEKTLNGFIASGEAGTVGLTGMKLLAQQERVLEHRKQLKKTQEELAVLEAEKQKLETMERGGQTLAKAQEQIQEKETEIQQKKESEDKLKEFIKQDQSDAKELTGMKLLSKQERIRKNQARLKQTEQEREALEAEKQMLETEYDKSYRGIFSEDMERELQDKLKSIEIKLDPKIKTPEESAKIKQKLDEIQKEKEKFESGDLARDLSTKKNELEQSIEKARSKEWTSNVGAGYREYIEHQARGKLLSEKLSKDEQRLVEERMSVMLRDGKKMDMGTSRFEGGAYATDEKKKQIEAIQKQLKENKKEVDATRKKEQARAQDFANLHSKQQDLKDAREKAEKEGKGDDAQRIIDELKEVETAIETHKSEGEDVGEKLKKLMTDRHKLKKDLEDVQGELRVKGDRLRNGDSTVADELSKTLMADANKAKASGDLNKAQKLELESKTWQEISAGMKNGGAIAWNYAVADAKAAESSRLYRYGHNELLSDADQRVVWDERNLETPTNTLAELIEEFNKSFAELSYESFVENAASMFMGIAKKTEDGTVTDADKASLMGLMARGMDRAWMDDAIISIMADTDAREKIGQALGWKDVVFSTNKIRDVEMLFATGGNVDFASKNVVVSEALDVGEHELGMEAADVYEGLRTGVFKNKEGKVVSNDEFKAAVRKSLRDQRRMLTDQQEEWFGLLLDDAGKQTRAREGLVEGYLNVIRENQSQMQYLGNIRDEAIKGGHGENAGWALVRDVGDGEQMYTAMGVRSARAHVMGDVNKTDLRLRAKAHPHMVADIDETTGALTNVRLDDYARVRNGMNYRTHSGTTGRFIKQMSGVTANDETYDFLDDQGRFEVGGSAGMNATFERQNQTMYNMKTKGVTSPEKIKKIKQALTAREIVKNIYAPQMKGNMEDFLLTLATVSKTNPMKATNDGEMNLSIPILNDAGDVEMKEIRKVDTLITLMRNGAFGHVPYDIPNFEPPKLTPEERAQQELEMNQN